MNPIRECRPMFCAATEGAVFLCIMEAVSLKKLLDGEKDAIQLFANNFRTHGFCFYKDGHSFVREAKELEAFFEKPEEEKAKFKHPKIPLLGYSKVRPYHRLLLCFRPKCGLFFLFVFVCLFLELPNLLFPLLGFRVE